MGTYSVHPSGHPFICISHLSLVDLAGSQTVPAVNQAPLACSQIPLAGSKIPLAAYPLAEMSVSKLGHANNAASILCIFLFNILSFQWCSLLQLNCTTDLQLSTLARFCDEFWNRFCNNYKVVTDGLIDGQTNGPTDKITDQPMDQLTEMR